MRRFECDTLWPNCGLVPRRSHWRAIAFLLLLALAVAAAEAVDLSVVIELAHRAGPERMAVRRDVEVDHGYLLAVDLARVVRLHRRAADPLVAGRRVDEHDLVIVGMDAFFHDDYQL